MVFPLDEVLDLPPGEITVSLSKRALRLATYTSFGPLQEELFIHHGVRLSDSALDMLMQRAGGTAEQDRQSEIEKLLPIPRGAHREAAVELEHEGPWPERLYVSCDGVMYRTRYRDPDASGPDSKRLIFQEMKVGTVFWQDVSGQWQKRTLASRDDPQRFGLSLWALAVRCGMLQAKEVIFISDGGGWCDTVAKTYFHDAVRILDWYHLSEHVWEAGRALHPQDERATKTWVRTCLDHLHDASGIGLLRHLKRSRAQRSGASAEAIDDLIKYLEPRLPITDYVDYRAAGYVIGSGMMESTCKQVVTQRLKGCGMQWSESGAVAMAALITHRLNGTWEQFWASRPLQRAA